MPRSKKNAAPSLVDRQNLTAGLIDRLTCPDGKDKAFLRDSTVPGLSVRVTASGAKSFVFQAKLDRKTFLSRTLGDVKTWTIEQARTEAKRLPAQISGHKPSAVAEGYAILALDELRPYMGQIEREFLRLAGINFSESTIEPVKLMAV